MVSWMRATTGCPRGLVGLNLASGACSANTTDHTMEKGINICGLEDGGLAEIRERGRARCGLFSSAICVIKHSVGFLLQFVL